MRAAAINHMLAAKNNPFTDGSSGSAAWTYGRSFVAAAEYFCEADYIRGDVCALIVSVAHTLKPFYSNWQIHSITAVKRSVFLSILIKKWQAMSKVSIPG